MLFQDQTHHSQSQRGICSGADGKVQIGQLCHAGGKRVDDHQTASGPLHSRDIPLDPAHGVAGVGAPEQYRPGLPGDAAVGLESESVSKGLCLRLVAHVSRPQAVDHSQHIGHTVKNRALKGLVEAFDHQESIRAVLCQNLAQPLGGQIKGLLPGDLPPFIAAPDTGPQQGATHPVRVVHQLQSVEPGGTGNGAALMLRAQGHQLSRFVTACYQMTLPVAQPAGGVLILHTGTSLVLDAGSGNACNEIALEKDVDQEGRKEI